MTLDKICTLILENMINSILNHDISLNTTYQYLHGKSLAIFILKINSPIILIFNNNQVQISRSYSNKIDCTVIINFNILWRLYHSQKLTNLINNGIINVSGDHQIIHKLLALFDRRRTEIKEFLTLYIGDIVAQSIGNFIHYHYSILDRNIEYKKKYLSHALTEEWKLVLGAMEIKCFKKEINILIHRLNIIDQYVNNLEKKCDLF
ncbi:SCP2 sterol-binding domain-containing protein [Candidatus Erwinia haradaeae]|uniref:Ubiquinone biosynthesis protein UbiJ n=1 Tax=Candidatus Erwinia haradaeae TaxID=1922217 RepID=A0A451D3G8_9GAMM|nr:SCP2 sterol-binding domain-containing protein [Candidatus Erwinia haradaeae]VFP80209.1 Ubiquinone biosynthesis protein UbiJ [Candidatus Erwinia haradaeae]